MAEVTLRHVGVLELHYSFLARQQQKVVDLILDSVAFGSSGSGAYRHAVFVVAALGEGELKSVAAYAVDADAFTGLRGPKPMLRNIDGTPAARWLGESAPAGSCYLDMLVKSHDAKWGTAVSNTHAVVGAPVAALLEAAVADIPVDGHKGRVKVACKFAQSPYVSHLEPTFVVPVWIVYW